MNINNLIHSLTEPSIKLEQPKAGTEQLMADLSCLSAFPVIYEAVNMYIKDRSQLSDLIYQIAHIQDVFQNQLLHNAEKEEQ